MQEEKLKNLKKEYKMSLSNDLLELYGIKVFNITNLTGGWINDKYLVTDMDGKKYVLKELSSKKFPSEHFSVLCETVYLQKDLYDNNLLVPNVVRNRKNKLITIFSNKKYYFLQDYIQGNSKDFNKLSITEINNIAFNLALLHKFLKLIPIKKFTSKFLIFKDIDILQKEFDDRIKQIVSDTNDSYKKELELHNIIINDIEKSNILNEVELQLIHGDFTPDNIILNKNGVQAFIDFELCRINTKLQDIGRIILSICLENAALNKEKLISFIQGYSKIYSLDSKTISLAIKFVWINEVNIWIQERYFKNYNPPKVEKFISEIQWISNNWFKLEDIIRDVIFYE